MPVPSTIKELLPPGTRIQEQAWLAWLAARCLGTRRVAVAWRSSILLWGVNRPDFLANAAWVRHEVCHLKQYRRYGTAGFLLRYGLGWLRYGYQQHPMELEARAAEAAAD